MSEKYIDFDAYREEKENDKLIIKAFDEELELPPSPRLSIMEKLLELRNKKGDEADIPEQEIFVMLENLLGKEQLRKLIDNGVTTEEAEWLLMQIWQQYNSTDDEEDGSKNETNSTSQKNGD
ncbi:MAG: hypothetical protein ACQEQD_04405 [Bacillota bacterium]